MREIQVGTNENSNCQKVKLILSKRIDFTLHLIFSAFSMNFFSVHIILKIWFSSDSVIFESIIENFVYVFCRIEWNLISRTSLIF